MISIWLLYPHEEQEGAHEAASEIVAASVGPLGSFLAEVGTVGFAVIRRIEANRASWDSDNWAPAKRWTPNAK